MNVVQYAFNSNSDTQKWILEPVANESVEQSIQTSSTYTADGNYLKSVIDARGKTTTYNFNATKGTLGSVIDANNKTTSYTYNDLTDQIESVSKNATSITYKNGYTYVDGLLKSIKSGNLGNNQYNLTYKFGYDVKGNNYMTKVGKSVYDANGNEISYNAKILKTDTYNSTNNLVKSTLYGNGNTVGFKYDSLDRISSVDYGNDSDPKFKYVYDATGSLGIFKDLVNSFQYRYIYDLSGRASRLEGASDSGDIRHLSQFQYDTKNNMNNMWQKITVNKVSNPNTLNGTYYSNTKLVYDKDVRLTKLSLFDNGQATSTPNNELNFSYDGLGRTTSKTSTSSDSGTNKYNTDYAYVAGNSNYNTTTLLNSITSGKKVNNVYTTQSTVSYAYDNLGNITQINKNGGVTNSYCYDEINQLIRSDPQRILPLSCCLSSVDCQVKLTT